MKKRRIIALVFNGEEPNMIVLASLSKVLETACLVEGDVEGYTYDEKDVMNLIAKSLNTTVFKNLPHEESQYACKTPEDNAAVFIGIKMKQVLGANYSPMLLMTNLVKEMANAKKRPNNQMNKEFMNALFILSQPDLNIGKEILEETNLDDDKIAVIRDTYNLMKSHE